MIVCVLFIPSNSASATTYYVSTTGNDGNGGQSIGDAWLTLNKAADTITAGDTAYIINGTYTVPNDIGFQNSGTSSNPITMVAYNGTPYLIGDVASTINYNGKQWINVSGLELFNTVRKVHMSGSNNTLHNCTLSGSTTGANTIHLGSNAAYHTIIDCTFYNQSGGQNLMDLVTDYGAGVTMHDIIIHNCTFYNVTDHNVINFYDKGNDQTHKNHWNFTLTNNTVYSAYTNCIVFATNWVNLYDSDISNNTIYDADRGISLYLKDSTVNNNYVYDIDNEPYIGTNDRYITGTTFDSNNGRLYLKGTDVTVINPLQRTSVWSSGSTVTIQDWTSTREVLLKFSGGVILEQLDGNIHSSSKTGGSGTYNIAATKYYPSKSNSSIDLTNDATTTFNIVEYDVRLKPSTGYLKDVVLNTYDLPNDIYNVTVNSSVAENPTWINVTVANASNTYTVSKDGNYYDTVVSDSDSVARYYYTVAGDEWSTHDFEFTWSSSAGDPPGGDYIIGDSGDLWEGNCTYDSNITLVQCTGNVELEDLNPALTKIRMDNNSLLDENTTNSNDGTNHGATYNSNGYYGGKFDFDTNDYVDLGTMGTFGSEMATNKPTFVTWVNSSETSSIVSLMGTHNDGSNTAIKVSLNANSTGLVNTGHIRVFLRDEDDHTMSGAVESNTGITDGTDHQLSVHVDGPNNKYIIYLDGVPQTVVYASQNTPDNFANFQYGMYLGGVNSRGSLDSALNGSLDDARFYNYNLSQTVVNQTRDNHHEITGNVTTNHDFGANNETYKFDVNFTTPTNTNYTVWYRDNNTGNFVQLGGTYTGNQTISISGTKYQDTEVRVVLQGNTTETPELIRIVFYRQSSGDITAPTYNNVAHNTTEAGASCLFSIRYNDDVALHHNGQWIFSTNNTGSWVNDSAVNWTATPEYANISKTLNSTHGTVVGYRWYADDNAGNDNNTPIYTLTVQDTTLPVVTLLSQTPSTICQNCTGNISICYGISHSSPLNNTSISFIYRDYDHDLGDSNHSIRPPINNLASEWNFDGRILRGANRNESLNFENNATITGGGIYSWSGLDENKSEMSIVPVNSSYTKVYINSTIHRVMPQMHYIDRSEMEEAPKTTIAIHKNQDVLVKFWNFEIFKGNTDFLGVGYTDTALNTNPALHPSDINPVNYYYISSGYDPATGGDPLTSGYAVYMGSLNATGWVDYVYSPHVNSSYVRGFINNTLLHSYINTTNISYVLYTSNTPSNKGYLINVTDVATSSNISFANTSVLWAGDDAMSPQAYTPNIWFAFMKLNMSLDHKLYVADNNNNWANSTMNRTNITSALFPPTKPSFYAFHNGFQDFDMNGTYHDIIQVQVSAGSDPDGGVVTHNITLHYGVNNTYIATINSSAVAEDGVYTNITFNTTPYYSQTENYTLKVVATDDEDETATTWLGVNFTIYITPNATNLANTTFNHGVNYTWSAGSGAITDSYNVSLNSTWYNGSSQAWANNSTVAHGSIEIIVYAYNESSGLSAGYLTDNVTVSNNVPVLSGIPNLNTNEDNGLLDIIDLDDYYSDADSDTPSFSVESNNQSAHMTIDISGTNTVDFIPDADWYGTAEIVFKADDGYGGTDTDTMIFTVRPVNDAPVLDSIGAQNVNENEILYINADATDVEGDTLTFSCSRTDLFTDFSTSTGQGNWTPGFADAGTYYVDFGVSDGSLTDNETVTITVTDVPTLVITSYTPLDTTPRDIINNSRTFTVNINQVCNVTWYINGVLQQTNTSVDNATYIPHATDGTWNVTASATNNNGTDSQTWTWIVEEQPTALLFPIYVLVLIFAVCMTGYTFLINDINNYTHIITGFSSGVIYFIAGYYAYIGIGFDWIYDTGSATSFEVVSYQYSWLGTMFVVFDIIMFLYSAVQTFGAVQLILAQLEKNKEYW